jgi:hypothetical protein
LLSRCSSSNSCVVFTLNGPKLGLLISKYCQICDITFKTDNYVQNDKSFLYSKDSKFQKYVVTSCQSVFEIALLDSFDKHLVRNAITFSGVLLILSNFRFF